MFGYIVYSEFVTKLRESREFRSRLFEFEREVRYGPREEAFSTLKSIADDFLEEPFFFAEEIGEAIRYNNYLITGKYAWPSVSLDESENTVDGMAGSFVS